MDSNIVFPKATDSWGEITAFAVGSGKDSFAVKKNSKGKLVEVEAGKPIVTWDIPGVCKGEFNQECE